MFNSEPVDKENSNVNTMLLMENLPDYESYFFPVETDGAIGEEEMYGYSDLVYAPWRFEHNALCIEYRA